MSESRDGVASGNSEYFTPALNEVAQRKLKWRNIEQSPSKVLRGIKSQSVEYLKQPLNDPFVDESKSADTKELRISSPFTKLINKSSTEHKVQPHHHHKASRAKPVIEESASVDDNNVSLEILEEIAKVQDTFQGLEKKYRLIDKIGEGTFSTVYKAEDISGRARYLMGDSIWSSPEIKKRKILKKKKKTFVALKRIYVTSSPQRIFNELNLLYMLSGSSRIAPLLEALRYQDQIIAVLPYYPHADFREFFRDLPIDGIRVYMFELFEALNYVHEKKIIHRDIKPTNFLYDPWKKKGVLVDFGLAEQENLNIAPLDSKATNYCPCYSENRPSVHEDSIKGYPKDDTRPGRRANRAGTRGFRAPEVLLKCPHQTTKIDIWSAGVILLTLLSRRFPFFNSPDDVDALVELTTIFGLKEMQECAALHGLGLDSSLNTLGKRLPLSQLINWAINTEDKASTLPDDSVAYDTWSCFNDDGDIIIEENDSSKLKYYKKAHKEAFDVMESCFKLNHHKRSSADKILKLPFFASLRNRHADEGGGDDDDNDDDDDDVCLVKHVIDVSQ